MFLESTEAHMAMLYPPPRGGFGTKEFDWRIHEFIGYKGFKFPCGGYKKGPNTQAHKLPKKKVQEARHGGGMCEFALSTDGGKSFHVIATYTKTCPDVMYEWPVRIPDNVPSCNSSGKCLFSWSWTAALVPQFYHNCADVTIEGVKDGKLPKKTIQLYDFGNHKKKVTFPGDGRSHDHGPGPISAEVKVASRRKSL
ncbi:hypothetical protein BGX23_005885 [Mortierella sp. AD031]|nr:hypothetical protein BGX23_005885 [Mortierella sp. AD031]